MKIINLKTFAKQLLKNKLYTFITVAGFAVSLAFIILLSVYIKNEISVNTGQKNSHRIYPFKALANHSLECEKYFK